ncbi:MAG: M28 family peptidase [Myxococcota bacterium]
MSLAWRLLEEQMSLGPRFVGCPGHRAMHGWLDAQLTGCERRDHRFEDVFFGASVECRNFVARFEGDKPGRLMLGTHYDTRPYADCDPDPEQHSRPVPGANDGASGTAVLLALREWLEGERNRPTVDLAFFDAEDWHGIDGKQVALGSRRWVAEHPDSELPDALVLFDMIGARGQRIQFDLSIHEHAPSVALSRWVHGTALALGLDSFAGETPGIIVQDDHTPFLERGVPCCVLIDMDYAPWHTRGDVIEACCPGALDEMGRLARELLVKIALTTGSR